jgi:chemotaxis signal transduction protein
MSVDTSSPIPSFVVFQIGKRRVALSQNCVAELIASPVLFSFPHTSPLITGIVLRRGRIVPVMDLGPGILGEPSPLARFFLVVERQISNVSERCAIPVQGECELVSAIMLPAAERENFVIGSLDLNEEHIDILDLEKVIAAGATRIADFVPATEALS